MKIALPGYREGLFSCEPPCEPRNSFLLNFAPLFVKSGDSPRILILGKKVPQNHHFR